MADWTVITDTQVDPDAPLTSSLGFAWRDNCIAIAEGASGAPRVVGKALNLDATTFTASTTAGGVTGIALGGWLDVTAGGEIFNTAGGASNVGTIYARVSSNSGGSWGSWFLVCQGTIAASSRVTFVLSLKVRRSDGNVYGGCSFGTVGGILTSFGGTDIDSIQFYFDGTSIDGSMRGLVTTFGVA